MKSYQFKLIRKEL